MITNSGRAQGSFDWPGLEIGAKENGVLRPRDSLGESSKLDGSNDFTRFILIRLEGAQGNLCAVTFVRPQRLRAAPRVVFDEGIGGVEDDAGGTIVLFQLYDLHLGKMFFEV